MKLIIDIPEENYKKDNLIHFFGCYSEKLDEVIKNGTPLPKGHTALISKEQAIELVEYYQLNPQHFDFVNLIEEIKDEKPIIEADKE